MMFKPLYTQRFEALPKDTQNHLKKTFKRVKVTQKQTVDSYIKFSSVIAQAKEFAKQWDKLLDDVLLDYHLEEDYGSYSCVAELKVENLETDEQYYQRVLHQWQWMEAQDERERKEFERLKAKFDK